MTGTKKQIKYAELLKVKLLKTVETNKKLLNLDVKAKNKNIKHLNSINIKLDSYNFTQEEINLHNKILDTYYNNIINVLGNNSVYWINYARFLKDNDIFNNLLNIILYNANIELGINEIANLVDCNKDIFNVENMKIILTADEYDLLSTIQIKLSACYNNKILPYFANIDDAKHFIFKKG